MEVAAGDGHQIELAGPVSEPPAQAAGDPRAIHFDSPEPRRGQRFQGRHTQVERGVGQSGHAPGATHQADRLDRIQPRLGHDRWAFIAQEPAKGLALAAHLTRPRR